MYARSEILPFVQDDIGEEDGWARAWGANTLGGPVWPPLQDVCVADCRWTAGAVTNSQNRRALCVSAVNGTTKKNLALLAYGVLAFWYLRITRHVLDCRFTRPALAYGVNVVGVDAVTVVEDLL